MKKLLGVIMVLAVACVVSGVSEAGEINVLVWDDAHTQAVETLISEFEEKTGITVNFEKLPSRSMIEKLAVGVSADSSEYDLVAVDEPFVPMFADLMIPYDEWAEGKTFPKVGLDEVMPAAFEAGQWNGQNKGFPINGNVYVWMTRKDLIENPDNQKAFKEKYGYDLGVPETFDQLADMGEFFAEQGISGFGPFTKKSEGATCEATFFFESYGTSVLSVQDGTIVVSLDKAKAVDAIKMYKKLMALAPKGAADYGHSERIAAFSLGKIFAMFQWPAIIPSHENEDESMVAGNIIYSAPPAGPAKKAPVRGCWILAIPKAAKNKAEAAEFAYWWGSKDSGKKLVEAGMTPVRPDLLNDPELLAARPWFEGIFDSMKHAVNRPRFAKYAEVSDVIQVNWMAAVTGTMTPEEAVDKMIEDVQNILKKYGY